jgi:hypothetical protein
MQRRQEERQLARRLQLQTAYGGSLVNTRLIIATLAIPVVIFLPSRAMAQQTSSAAALQQSNLPPQAQSAAQDIEEAARRFGFGVRAGVGLDPELIDIGAHATFGPIFTPSVSYRPGI